MSLQFFVADDGVDGAELWVTNGTSAGTFLLKDIRPGLSGSSVANMVQSNGIMYFTANDGSATHLWRSDGTTAGTFALTTSNNGDGSSSLVNVNGTLFFLGSDFVHGTGLFKTDGTVAGTQFVKTVASATNLFAVGNTLFFQASDSTHGAELWKSDGTAAGTGLVSDIYPGTSSSGLGNFTASGGKLYFTATDGTHGTEPWVSDGTAAGTFQLKDINNGTSGSGPANLVAAGGKVFFTASDGANGTQLWATDGTAAGTVKQFTSDATSPYPSGTATAVVFNNQFYFLSTTFGAAICTADGAGTVTRLVGLSSFSGTFYNLGSTLVFYGSDGTHGTGLYAFNGTTATFVAAVNSSFAQVAVSNGKLYFVNTDAAHGAELWVSDGTAGGTHITADINPGTYDASITNISAVNGGVVFSATRPDVGTELFYSDGTAAGTGLAANINATANHAPSLSIGNAPVAAGSLSYFAADDGIHGSELFVTDGTTAGTHLVTDLVAGATGSGPGSFVSSGGKIFYIANDGTNGSQLYTSDGSTVTRLTSSSLDAPINGNSYSFTLGGKFYYYAYNASSQAGIATSDGTVAGTQVVAQFNHYAVPLQVGSRMILFGSDGTHAQGLYTFDGTTVTFVTALSYFTSPVVSGGKVFFTNTDSANGTELWVTDGTAAGTHITRDVNPGTYSASVGNVIGLGNGSVVFTATTPERGNEVYVSDGTSAGTTLLADINTTGNHAQSLSIGSAPVAAGTLSYFAADDGIHGSELFVTDGTTAGTHLVTDLVVGSTGSGPSGFLSAGGRIFFTANDGTNGNQLYTSDGNTVTRLTSNSLDAPYQGSSYSFVLGGKLYYSALNSSSQAGIATSDGTVAGTQLVAQFSFYATPLQLGSGMLLYGSDGTHAQGLYTFNGTALTFVTALSSFTSPVVSGGKAFFTNTDSTNGTELWVTDGTAAGTHITRDVNPGNYSASVGNIISLGNGSVVFTATTPDKGNEVYVSDGTSAGTTLLADINTTSNHVQSLSIGGAPVAAGSLSYFAADDGIHGSELFVTDGTTAGTHLVTDLYTGANGSGPSGFLSVGGKIFFTASDGTNGNQLYTSDGSTVTRLTSNSLDAPYQGSSYSFALGGKLYYSALNASGQAGIASSDGTVAGTQVVTGFSFYATPLQLGSTMLLYGSDGTHAGGLYTFDGTNTTFVTALSYFNNPVVSGSKVFFVAYDGTNGYELWSSDGTAAGTHITKDIYAGSSSSSPGSITSIGNGKVVFTATDATNGNEIWVSDGTAAGTVLLGDLFAGATGSNPANLTQVGSKVFFTANYYSTSAGAFGTELFVTDGTSAGTHLVSDLTTGSGSTSFYGFFTQGSTLYFSAYANSGYHFYATNGSTVTEITPASGSISTASNFVAAGASHFFFTSGNSLFYSDGTSAGTAQVSSALSSYGSFSYANGKLLFSNYDGTNGYELWSSDGTTAGTGRVTDTLIPNSSNATNFQFVGGKVFFTADDGSHGSELWVTDGTSAGTHLVSDLTTGSAGTSFYGFFAQGSTLYFSAYANSAYHFYATNGSTVTEITPASGSISTAGNFVAAGASHFFFTSGNSLFYSDGTSAGTAQVSSALSSYSSFSYANGKLLFSNYDGANGYELWSSDGTTAGTGRVTDTLIPNSSNATNFQFVGGKVFFTADDGSHGSELWVTDGTSAGTHLVSDLTTGSGSTSFYGFFTQGSTLYFSAYANSGYHFYATNGSTVTEITPASGSISTAGNFVAAGASHFFFTSGNSLFYSDGTSAGTAQVSSALSSYGSFSYANGKLLFSNYDGTNGYELWSSDGTTAGTGRVTDTNTPNSSNPTSFAAVDNFPPTVSNAAASAITDQQTNRPFQNVVIGDPDLPAQTLTVTVTPDDPAKGHFSAASLAASGFIAGGVAGSYTFTGLAAAATTAIEALVYVPTQNRLVVGNSETITYTIAANDGAGGSVVNKLTVVTQTSANDAPVAAGDSGAPVNEDATVSVGSRAAGLLANDTDVDVGETATLVVQGAHAGTSGADTAVAASGTTAIHGVYGDLLLAANGTYSYTPNTAAAEALAAGQPATELFTYTVADVHGATSTATLTFAITGQEDAPTPVADAVALAEDASAVAATRAGGLLGNDTDVDNGETATLRVTGAHAGSAADTAVAASGTTLLHGTYGDLVLAADGTYSYAATSGAAEALAQGTVATDRFGYTVTDAQGVSVASSVTFTITGQNDAPVATGENASVYEDATVSVGSRAAGLLVNDTDVDVGETATLVVQGAHAGTSGADTAVAAGGTTAIHGIYGDLLLAANGTYSYTPNTAAAEALAAGQPATELFTYTVADVHGATSTATLSFAITGVNDAPSFVASGAQPSYVENDPFVVIAPSISLVDDNPNFAGGTLTIALTTGFAAGDVIGFRSSATPGIGIGIDAQTGIVRYNNVAIGQLGAVSVTSATVTFTAGAATAAAVTALAQAATYTNTGDDPGAQPRTISFKLVDGAGTANGGADTTTFTRTVAVTPVDDPAVAVADSGGTAENAVLHGASVLVNDYDVDGPALAIAKVNGAAVAFDTPVALASGALLTVHANGTYDYDPNHRFDALAPASSGAANTTATDGFAYTLVNGGTANVAITISGVASAADVYQGSSGNDTIVGGDGGHSFDLSQGGADRVTGGNGNDVFYFGAALTAADTVDGGAGSDQVTLNGDYTGAGRLVLGATTITNVETLALTPGHGYDIKTADGTVSAGGVLTVSAGGLLGSDALTFDGSAETDGSFRIVAGSGIAHLTGGAGNDSFSFAPGSFRTADTIDGGAGHDVLTVGVMYHVFSVGVSNGVASLTGAGGVATITNIEDTSFQDGHLVIDANSNGAQIQRLYDAVLGRQADPVGLDYWVHQVDSGAAILPTVAAAFASSGEFQAVTGGLSNAQFVDYLYQHALGRSADQGGHDFWTGQLNAGLSRGDMVLSFSETAEHRALTAGTVSAGYFDTDPVYQQVALLYDGVLGRLPDAGGEVFWAESIKSGTYTLAQVADAFAGSGEFAQATAGMNNGQLLDYVYQHTLHRGADGGGLAYWSDQLDHGLTKGALVLAFAESGEHASLDAANIVNGIVLA